MEEKYQAEIEKKRAESVNRAWKIISVFVVVFQLLMLILMAAKPGGPFKTQRRAIYCILYLTLFLVTGIAMILNRNFWRREKKNTICIFMLSWFTRHLSASGAVVLL